MNVRMASLAMTCLLGIVSLLTFGRIFSLGIDQATAQEQAQGASDHGDVAHGKYLVHHVAHCNECHTPRNKKGELIPTRLLSGAAIPLQAPANLAPWGAESASIAGLGNYDRAFVIYLLSHGRRPDGSRPKNPMPSFKLTMSDAQDVVAYLESL